MASSSGRSLVDVLLQELDAIGAGQQGRADARGDERTMGRRRGAKRPGRFDRTVFVPPPDEPARERIRSSTWWSGMERTGWTSGASRRRLTPLFSGADLRDVVERAVDEVIDEALSSGGEPPLTQGHLERALEGMRPSTLEWLGTPRRETSSIFREPRGRLRRRRALPQVEGGTRLALGG